MNAIIPTTDLDSLLEYLESQGRISQTDDGIDVFMTQAEMADYFGVSRPAVTRLVNNYRKEDPDGFSDLCNKLLYSHSAADRPTYVYNLDVIIYVGYRVHSTKRARAFRNRVASMVKTQLAVRLAKLKQENSDLRQVNRWLGGRQGAGRFIEDSQPNAK